MGEISTHIYSGRETYLVWKPGRRSGFGKLDHESPWHKQEKVDERSDRSWRADLSPDGTQVVFYSRQNTPRPGHVFVMNVNGTGVKQLTPKN
jgi:hypothetical protein